jgi:hypothetical protein
MAREREADPLIEGMTRTKEEKAPVDDSNMREREASGDRPSAERFLCREINA